MKIGEIWKNVNTDEKVTIIAIKSHAERNLSSLEEALHNFLHRNAFGESIDKSDDWVFYRREDGEKERTSPRRMFVRNWKKVN